MDILNNKVVKYAVLAVIIMILFTTLFNNTRISYKDSIMISLIIILAFIVIDNVCNMYSNPTAEENFLSTLEGFKGSTEPYKLPDIYQPFIRPHVGGNLVAPETSNTVQEAVQAAPITTMPAIKPEESKAVAKPEESKAVAKPEESKAVAKPEEGSVVSKPEESRVVVKIEESRPEEMKVVASNSEESRDSSALSESVSEDSEERKVPKYKSDVRLATANVKERKGCRWQDDVITSDMKYTDYNHLPLADGYDSRDYEYGYSFLPPEKWYPQPPFPPVCVTNKRCDVFPMFTTGSNLDLKEWNSSLRVSAPDNINVDYIREKLNSGR